MIDKSKTYTTWGGLRVQIYRTDAGGDFPVHGAMLSFGSWESLVWSSDGKSNIDSSGYRSLVEVKPKRTLDVVVNVYQSIDGTQSGTHFACVRFTREITEGEGL